MKYCFVELSTIIKFKDRHQRTQLRGKVAARGEASSPKKWQIGSLGGNSREWVTRRGWVFMLRLHNITYDSYLTLFCGLTGYRAATQKHLHAARLGRKHSQVITSLSRLLTSHAGWRKRINVLSFGVCAKTYLRQNVDIKHEENLQTAAAVVACALCASQVKS